MKSVSKIVLMLSIIFLSACSTSSKTPIAQASESQNSEVQSIPEKVKFNETEQEIKSENTFDVSKVAPKPKGNRTQKSPIPSKK
ncbi:MAG: hypothetical protein HYX61_03635 [Gammaproteobacteria bacterium]|jgi:uncharacterized lipoprotein|nr:hypothetical protein [Gammaproteobacteria bacterium]